MKKFLVSLGVASAIVGSTVWWTQKNEAVQAQNDTPTQSQSVPVVAVSVQQKSASHTATRTIAVPGTVEALQSTTLRAGVAGFVAQLPIALGQTVGTGATIAVIDDMTGSLSAENGFQSSDYQKTQLNEMIAQKELNQARKTYRNDKTSANKTSKTVATLNRDKAVIDVAQASDARTVRAPFAGVVAEKLVDLGDQVSAGQAIATITQGQARVLRFFVDATEAAHLSRNQSISFTLSDGTEYRASVTRVAPFPDTVTRKILVEASLPKEAAGVSLATLGTVRVTVTEAASDPQAILVPLEALTTGQNESYIFTETDGVAHRQTVTVRQVRGDVAEVAWDGPEDAQVIVEGARQVTDGARVEVEAK